VTGHALNHVHCGLVKKLVCAACIDISDSARPSKIIQKALESGEINLENWSLCSLQQRLMAGAFGFPFIPTRSITGSDIASDHPDTFREIKDPFGSGLTAGIIKSLNPDISIIHGCAGDEEGNIILSAPYGDDLWGALASTGGVIATVEKIVPSDYIRRYAALVRYLAIL
jgi:acyl CoA:acetate/3-ketoacid CoA transferase alpha subunit